MLLHRVAVNVHASCIPLHSRLFERRTTLTEQKKWCGKLLRWTVKFVSGLRRLGPLSLIKLYQKVTRDCMDSCMVRVELRSTTLSHDTTSERYQFCC